MRESAVSLSFTFTHPPKNKNTKYKKTGNISPQESLNHVSDGLPVGLDWRRKRQQRGGPHIERAPKD